MEVISAEFPKDISEIQIVPNPAEPEIVSGRHHIQGWCHLYDPETGVPDFILFSPGKNPRVKTSINFILEKRDCISLSLYGVKYKKIRLINP
jgi:hypothetical protein